MLFVYTSKKNINKKELVFLLFFETDKELFLLKSETVEEREIHL